MTSTRRNALGQGLGALALAAAAAFLASGQGANLRALEQLLANAGDRSHAMRIAVSLGKDAPPALSALALDPQAELRARGWAMVCLSHLEGSEPKASTTFRTLLEDRGDEPLARLWAAGGLAQVAPPEETLAAMLGVISAEGLSPPPPRNFRGRGRVRQPSQAPPPLGQALSEAVVTQGKRKPSALASVCLEGRDNEIRRLAASFLGASQVDSEEARKSYIEALRFGETAEPPWKGGALFVPGVAWTEEQARDLLAELVHWMLWAEAKAASGPAPQDLVQQVRNNLVSVAATRAGFGWDWSRNGTGWALLWSDKWGKEADASLCRQATALLAHALEREPENGALLSRLQALRRQPPR
jgi:hypothetical protein